MESPLNQKGFTLIELIIVMAIISVVLGITILSSRDIMDSYKLRGAARQIYGDMQSARLRAIKDGVKYALEYSGNTYVVKTPGGDGSFGTGDDFVIKSIDLAADFRGVSISSSPVRNIFNPKGTASSSSVILTNGVNSKTIKVNQNTGNIRIE